MVDQRRALTDDKTRFTNRLGDTLKQYYPQALKWFDHRDTVLFCDFLTRWPTQMQAKKASCLVSAQSMPIKAVNDVLVKEFISFSRSEKLMEETCVLEFCEGNIVSRSNGMP